jgi:Flp pilus assembly protein TadG
MRLEHRGDDTVSAGRWPFLGSTRAAANRTRGQALVEFALAIPIFLLLLMGLFDLGRAVFSYNTLTNAAREGVRLAIVNQDVPSIIAHAKAQSAIVELNDPSVKVGFYMPKTTDGSPDTTKPCNPVAVSCLAVVSFEATYEPITPIISNILFKNGVTMTAKSVLTVEYSCPNAVFTTADKCPKQP